MKTGATLLLAVCALRAGDALALSHPVRAKHGMVVAEHFIASRVGTDALWDGGNAVDAAVATAFALAVVHPKAGNIGGGGFLVFRSGGGESAAYDFREQAPAAAKATMFLRAGRYDKTLHHDSALSVGVPGTVAGLHLAWKEHGKLPWKRLLEPAIALAREGFVVTDGLARSLKGVLPAMKPYAASIAQFSRKGAPYEAGDLLTQADLARTLERIAESGPAGFYEGETARLIEKELKARGGLVTAADLKAYQAKRRTPLSGSYRGYQIVTMPPPSGGGIALVEMLNVLEGYDLAAKGFGSAAYVHLVAESMRRAFADRARHLGDPEANPGMPVERLVSKEYAASLRKTIREERASKSSPETFEWPPESGDTTHVSVVDEERNAVALTYTLEDNYGSKIVVPGAGFLLNNEMGDFNAGPGLTNAEGLIGGDANLAAPGKRMLSSMTPSILSKDGKLFMVVGSPGGRKIISVVLLAILNVIDFGMNVQEAVDAPRFHHQWLPDRILHEKWGLSPDARELLQARGHVVSSDWPPDSPTSVEAIVYDAAQDVLEGAYDHRGPDAMAMGH